MVGSCFVFGYLLFEEASGGEIRGRHVVTKRASVKKVDIESVEGVISLYFPSPSFSIVVSPFCCLSSATWRSKATPGE